MPTILLNSSSLEVYLDREPPDYFQEVLQEFLENNAPNIQAVISYETRVEGPKDFHGRRNFVTERRTLTVSADSEPLRRAGSE